MYRIIIFFVILLSLNISSAEELKTISAEEFIAQNPSPERKEIVSFILKQFDNQNEVTQEEIDYIWNNKENRQNLQMIRFQVVNQQLYADSFDSASGHSVLLFKFFQNFIKQYKVPDVDFIIYISDLIHLQPTLDQLDTPVFMMSKDLSFNYEKSKLLLPDAFMMGNSWKIIAKKIQQENINIPWENKVNKVFWRGSTTNGIYSLDNFDRLPRLTLTLLSKLYPHLIDAKFTTYTNFNKYNKNKGVKNILDILWSKKPEFVSKSDHIKYKYLASVDGHTCAWLRVPWIMLSNSVLLKQETNKIQWFYSAMKPYVHYIPLKEDISDIFLQIDWMKNNDLDLQRISENSTKFVIDNLMPEHINSYVSIILNKYHSLHKDRIIATLPPADHFLSTWTLTRILYARIRNNFLSWIESFF